MLNVLTEGRESFLTCLKIARCLIQAVLNTLFGEMGYNTWLDGL